ncbi:hypothetical protein SMICM17S_12253 [Streptomyces microflavus]
MTVPTQPPATPDLLYSQDEEDLRSAVRALLADRADAPTVIAATKSNTPYDPRLWEALATGIGAAGLLVPEKLGGQGACTGRPPWSWRSWAAGAGPPPVPDQLRRGDRDAPRAGRR